jgi:hypothetical protein
MPAELEQHELAVRESDGLHVALLWDRHTDAVTVSVEDRRMGERFHLAVAPERALDAFHHPFAYAAQAPERCNFAPTGGQRWLP